MKYATAVMLIFLVSLSGVAVCSYRLGQFDGVASVEPIVFPTTNDCTLERLQKFGEGREPCVSFPPTVECTKTGDILISGFRLTGDVHPRISIECVASRRDFLITTSRSAK